MFFISKIAEFMKKWFAITGLNVLDAKNTNTKLCHLMKQKLNGYFVEFVNPDNGTKKCEML